MSWSTNSQVSAALAKDQQNLVFAIQIGALDYYYSTAPIPDALPPTYDVYPTLQLRSWEPGGVNPQTGELKFSSLEFAIINADEEVYSNVLASEKDSARFHSLFSKDAEVYLWIGSRDTAWGYFDYAGTFRIESVKVSSTAQGNTEAVFKAVDPFPEVDRPLFAFTEDKLKTTLAEFAGIGDTSLEVADRDGFEAGDHIMLRLDNRFEFHKVLSTSKSGSKYYINLDDSAVLGGWFRPDASEVHRVAILEGHPVNILMRILLDDFTMSGQNQTDFPLTAVKGSFDEGSGLGIGRDLLDITQIKNERDNFQSGMTARLVIPARIDNGKRYLLEYLQGLGYLYIRRDGTMGFKGLHLPVLSVGSEVAVVDETDTGSWQWKRDASHIINIAIVEGNNFDDELRVTLATSTDEDAVTDLGRFEKAIRPPWLWSDLNGTNQAVALGGRIVGRYARGPQQFSFQSSLQKLSIEVTDLVVASHPGMPDTFTGGRLTSASLEVISSTPDIKDRKMKIIAYRYGNARAGLIAPNGTNDYASATATEKNTYAFITDDDGEMPDGSAGYGWI